MTLYRAIKSWLEQLNFDGDFIPVTTIADEEQFKPMYLVIRKERKYIGRKTYTYHKTGIKLQDVLLSGDHAAELDVGESKLFIIGDEMGVKGEGSLAAGAEPVSIQMDASVSTSHVRNVKVKKRHVSLKYLSSVHDDGKVSMDHRFITHSEQNRRDLYLITEELVTVGNTPCMEFDRKKGSFTSKLGTLLKSAFQINVQGEKEQKRKIDIPDDCTVAFRICKLYIKDGDLYISIPPSCGTDNLGTFDANIITHRENGKIHKIIPVPLCARISPPWLIEGSKTNWLQRDIEEHCAQLFSFSARLRGQFLTGFVAIMREDDLLQVLKLQLEQALEGLEQFNLKTDCLELQELGKNLQDSSGVLNTSLAGPVLYFLQALDELTEVQLTLLADSVKKGILSKQLALVESILDGEKNFTVDAQLVSPFAEEDLNITGAMIESSGVMLQKEGPTLVGTGDPDALLALEALYVALYVLDKIQRAA